MRRGRCANGSLVRRRGVCTAAVFNSTSVSETVTAWFFGRGLCAGAHASDGSPAQGPELFEPAGAEPAVDFERGGGVGGRDHERAAVEADEGCAIAEGGRGGGGPGVVGAAEAAASVGEIFESSLERVSHGGEGLGAVAPGAEAVEAPGVVGGGCAGWEGVARGIGGARVAWGMGVRRHEG